jgi:uncharacterized membrane protein YoaK (UPF0700 family)
MTIELQYSDEIAGAIASGLPVLALESTPFAGQESIAAIATGLVAAAAMGIQNTAARTIMSGLPPTTVMTGNLMQIIVDVVDLLHGHGALPAKRERLSKLVPLMLAFGAGALLGALGYLTIGFLALVAPILVAASLGFFGRPHPAAAAA